MQLIRTLLVAPLGPYTHTHTLSNTVPARPSVEAALFSVGAFIGAKVWRVALELWGVERLALAPVKAFYWQGEQDGADHNLVSVARI